MCHTNSQCSPDTSVSDTLLFNNIYCLCITLPPLVSLTARPDVDCLAARFWLGTYGVPEMCNLARQFPLCSRLQLPTSCCMFRSYVIRKQACVDGHQSLLARKDGYPYFHRPKTTPSRPTVNLPSRAISCNSSRQQPRNQLRNAESDASSAIRPPQSTVHRAPQRSIRRLWAAWIRRQPHVAQPLKGLRLQRHVQRHGSTSFRGGNCRNFVRMCVCAPQGAVIVSPFTPLTFFFLASRVLRPEPSGPPHGSGKRQRNACESARYRQSPGLRQFPNRWSREARSRG